MKLYQRSGKWYARVRTNEFYKNGRRIYQRISLDTDDQEEAERLFRALQSHDPEGEYERKKPLGSLTVEEFKNKFLAWMKANRSHKTYQAHKNVLQQLEEHVGSSFLLKELEQEHLDELEDQYTEETET